MSELPESKIPPIARLPEEWQPVLVASGEPGFRAKQVFRWIHRGGEFDPDKMTNLSLGLRQKLKEQGLAPPAEVADVHASRDGTRKLVLKFAGDARVECVIIPMTRLDDADAQAEASDEEDEEDEQGGPERTKVTLCISTQFGCAMGCRFCASGQAGLIRGLNAGEIVAQVLESRRLLKGDEELRNLVFMGMGEPLHHYDETARALRLLNHPEGGAMSLRRITVSTVGLVPGIKRLGEDFAGKVGLAISLHAPDDQTRDRIIPMNAKYPVAELIQALRDYPLPRRRRITIEYTLIAGVNDSLEQARTLSELLRGLRVKVNLIPMNPIEQADFRAPAQGRVDAFQDVLARAGYSCFVRTRRGDEVSAACGQLAMADELVRQKRERDRERAERRDEKA
ncbi:MAG TPA: 23S rRNA (adenine(2503)-C(2))-methyltransferase RlmN [Polyangiaceae bacterium]|nr:23S rRNA (adenine(2503)-C(2))-methyltransferase RlmN [Polyangiaceae bacterium]